jgi:hypothetical protein
MDEDKLVAIKTIPFVECDGVAFLGKNDLFVSSTHYSRFTVQNWKTGKDNNLGLPIYPFSFCIDRWKRNIVFLSEFSTNDLKIMGYNIQTEQSWVAQLPPSARMIDFCEQEQDSLVVENSYSGGRDNTKIYFWNCNDNSKQLQKPISSFLSKHNGAHLQYYNSTTQQAIYSDRNGLYTHNFKNDFASPRRVVTEFESRRGYTLVSFDNVFAIHMSCHHIYLIDLIGKKATLLLSDDVNRKHCSVIIHPSKYIFTMSCQTDSTIQVWDEMGNCILQQKSPTPDADDEKETARNYSAYWDAFSLSACRKYLAVAFPTQCVIYRLPFKIIYGLKARNIFPYKFFLLKNYDNNMLPYDMVRLILKKCMYVSRWQEN